MYKKYVDEYDLPDNYFICLLNKNEMHPDDCCYRVAYKFPDKDIMVRAFPDKLSAALFITRLGGSNENSQLIVMDRFDTEYRLVNKKANSCVTFSIDFDDSLPCVENTQTNLNLPYLAEKKYFSIIKSVKSDNYNSVGITVVDTKELI